jgi:ketosteroid isomerase-like protein
MTATDVVQTFLDGLSDGDGRGLMSDSFRLVGDAQGAPVLVFAVEGASARELAARGMEITFDEIQGGDEHVLVWGTWSGDGVENELYHVVLHVRDGKIEEARFFDDRDHARWFAGL